LELHTCRQISRRGGEGEQIVAGGGEAPGGSRELAFQGRDYPAELGVHLGLVGLAEDGADQGRHPRLAGLVHLRQKVTKVVKP
jgi:hypothetical protein